jgi:hypothetical protein
MPKSVRILRLKSRVTRWEQSSAYDVQGREIGGRAMLSGEDARVVAKQLLREKKQPESENFNRPLSYPNAGLA